MSAIETRDCIIRRTPFEFKETVVTDRPARFGRPRRRVQTLITGESMTQQSQKDDADIRVMWKRAQAAGVDLSQIPDASSFADLTSAPSYQRALGIVAQAREKFEELPAEVRDTYGNDPAKFLEGMKTRRGIQQLIDLGLAVEKPDPSPLPPGSPSSSAEGAAAPTAAPAPSSKKEGA